MSTHEMKTKQCMWLEGVHPPHYWSLAAIDGDSYYCPGITETMDRISESVDGMTVENVLALAERMDDYALADAQNSIWAGRLRDYQACAEILRRSVTKASAASADKSVQREESGRGQWDRPEHYGGEENPFEPIKIIECYDLNFNLGNVIKYVLRAPFKETALKDLKKAYTYIGFEIRRRERAGETE